MNRAQRIVVAALFSTVFFSFQNCSQVDVSFSPMSDLSSLAQAHIAINDGAAMTNSTSVIVNTYSPNTVVMYLTNDPSCLSGGKWLAQEPISPWTLGQENQTARVFAKFKDANGHESECVEATILHDGLSPTISITQAPPSVIGDAESEFKFDATDALSGVDRIECRVDTQKFAPCSNTELVKQLTDDQHTLQVRAVDKAGNISPETTHDWLVDTGAPTVTLTNQPAALSNSSLATFEFTGADSGSGVDSFICQIDSDPMKPCTSPAMYTGLTSSAHSFKVWSKDKAGHTSTPAVAQFTIDGVPPGAFNVTGITSGTTDAKIDAWMRGIVPTVNWTASADAVMYKVSILTDANQVACPEQATTQTSYTFAATCSLQNLTYYRAKVIAKDQVGNATETMFRFAVDTTPPVITATGPGVSPDPKNANFTLSVQDAAPGELEAVSCTKTFQGASVTQDCMNTATLAYTGLPYGDHVLKIEARDKAQNTSTREITWRVAPLICDPFSMTGNCMGGLVGDLYYLDANLQTEFKAGTKTVQFFFDHGIRVNALLNLSSLFVPTRHFDQGFPTADGNTIKDNTGATLFEYFAMKLKSQIRLDTTNPDTSKRDTAGDYEFAILSDDGAKLKMADSATSTYQTIVANDGDHSTKLGCSTTTVKMEADVGKYIQLEYYQGPRHEIAVTILWRKVSGTAVSNDPLCGTASTTAFFGPYPYGNTTNTYGFGQLIDRGWKVMTQYNFIAP